LVILEGRMPCVNRLTVLLCLEVPLWHSRGSLARSLTDRKRKAVCNLAHTMCRLLEAIGCLGPEDHLPAKRI
jgi:hypothetical protein